MIFRAGIEYQKQHNSRLHNFESATPNQHLSSIKPPFPPAVSTVDKPLNAHNVLRGPVHCPDDVISNPDIELGDMDPNERRKREVKLERKVEEQKDYL